MGQRSTIYIILVILTLFVFSACKQKPQPNYGEIVANINGNPIFINEVDQTVRQELYDELNRVYFIRKIALDEIINERLLDLEARKRNVSQDSLLNYQYKVKITDSSLRKFIQINGYDKGIPVLEHTLKSYSINTIEGYEVLIKKFKEYILNRYVDSIKTANKIEIHLKPPTSPVISINDLVTHYRGNIKSKVTVLCISDFDCDMCRESNPIFEELFKKYSNKVRFGFTHYGSYVSISAIASECAAKQGKFWEMHDSIFSSKIIPDTLDLFKLAENINLNMEQFKIDFYNTEIEDRINDNLYKLNAAGIYGTPTIMINNRLVFDSSSIQDIEKLLLAEISRLN